MPILFRYLLALLPPAWILPLIAQQRAAAGAMTGAIADERLHMTMLKWELRETRAAALVAAMRELLAPVELAACRVALTRRLLDGTARLVPGGRQDGLQALHDGLRRTLGALRPIAGGFRPHVTLGYAPRHAGGCDIPAIGWTAERLVLIESWHGMTRHRRLASWPLIERQGAFDFHRAGGRRHDWAGAGSTGC